MKAFKVTLPEHPVINFLSPVNTRHLVGLINEVCVEHDETGSVHATEVDGKIIIWLYKHGTEEGHAYILEAITEQLGINFGLELTTEHPATGHHFYAINAR